MRSGSAPDQCQADSGGSRRLDGLNDKIGHDEYLAQILPSLSGLSFCQIAKPLIQAGLCTFSDVLLPGVIDICS